MFGKSVGQYLAFQKYLLLLTAVVGLLRLGVSLAGAPNQAAAWLSMNVVLWASAVYYGVAVYTRGFGSYRQILPLVFIQVAIYHLITVAGIVLAIAGLPNVFAAPEYSGPADTRPPDPQPAARLVGRRRRQAHHLSPDGRADGRPPRPLPRRPGRSLPHRERAVAASRRDGCQRHPAAASQP